MMAPIFRLAYELSRDHGRERDGRNIAAHAPDEGEGGEDDDLVAAEEGEGEG